jgi:hypothetical protein
MSKKKKVPVKVIGVPDDRAICDVAQFFIASANAGHTLIASVRFLMERGYSDEAISEGCRYAVKMMCDYHRLPKETDGNNDKKTTKKIK